MSKILPLSMALCWHVNLSSESLAPFDEFISERHLYEYLSVESTSSSLLVRRRPSVSDLEFERAIETLKQCPHVESVVPPAECFSQFSIETRREDLNRFIESINITAREFLMLTEIKMFITEDGRLAAMATPRGARFLTMFDDITMVNTDV